MPMPTWTSEPVPLIAPESVNVSLRLKQRTVVDDVAGDCRSCRRCRAAACRR